MPPNAADRILQAPPHLEQACLAPENRRGGPVRQPVFRIFHADDKPYPIRTPNSSSEDHQRKYDLAFVPVSGVSGRERPALGALCANRPAGGQYIPDSRPVSVGALLALSKERPRLSSI